MSQARSKIWVGLHLAQAHFRAILRGAGSYARIHRLGWQLADDWSLGIGKELGRCAGAILSNPDQNVRQTLSMSGIPWVLVGARHPHHPGDVEVLPDNRSIGRNAAAHFVERTFRSFAFLGDHTHRYSCERLEGFLAGIAPSACQIMDKSDLSTEQRQRWLAGLPRGTALFCANDIWARAAIRNLRELDRAVPEDVAVLGVDNDSTVQALTEVPLSSVDPRSEAVGFEAARVLAGMIAGSTPRPRTLVACGPVVTRQSSDILMIDDPKVAEALARIRQSACDGLDADHVVVQSGLSRRALERRFNQTIGRGIAAELRRVRILKAKDLLMETDLPVGEIALAAGFSDAYYFSHAFSRETGKSPRTWRTDHRRDQ